MCDRSFFICSLKSLQCTDKCSNETLDSDFPSPCFDGPTHSQLMNPSGTSIDEEAISRLQQTSCRCRVFRDDFSISARTDAVPSYGSGTYVI